MIVTMFTGYAYVKSVNRTKKKEYITMQAQADDGGMCPRLTEDVSQLPKHVISPSTNSRQSSPIQQLYTSLKRQWEKKVNGG